MRRCQPCDSSNQVTARPPRRQPHRAACPQRAADHGRLPGPLRSVISTRTMPSPALTVTVTVSPGTPDLLCCRTAHEQRGVSSARVPGADHPDCECAGHPRPLCPPGNCHARPNRRPSHQRTASAASPSETAGRT